MDKAAQAAKRLADAREKQQADVKARAAAAATKVRESAAKPAAKALASSKRKRGAEDESECVLLLPITKKAIIDPHWDSRFIYNTL